MPEPALPLPPARPLLRPLLALPDVSLAALLLALLAPSVLNEVTADGRTLSDTDVRVEAIGSGAAGAGGLEVNAGRSVVRGGGVRERTGGRAVRAGGAEVLGADGELGGVVDVAAGEGIVAATWGK